MNDTAQFHQDVRPPLARFDQLASRYLLHLLALFFYLA
jgi:hypothetical protein